jgi:hypothetical protein
VVLVYGTKGIGNVQAQDAVGESGVGDSPGFLRNRIDGVRVHRHVTSSSCGVSRKNVIISRIARATGANCLTWGPRTKSPLVSTMGCWC